MSWLSSFMHPEEGYNKAQGQLDNYYNQAQGFQKPIADQGQQAFNPLFGAMQNLLNPQALQDQWTQSYSESPAAKQAQGLATQQGLDAASSMGLMGSTPALQAIQGGASQIALNDRQNYLDNLMQKYMAGAGIGQNIYQTGANAASNMSQNAMNMGQNSAQTAYNKESAGGDLFGKLLGGAAGLAGSALGGPLGGVLGTALGNKLGWSTGGK